MRILDIELSTSSIILCMKTRGILNIGNTCGVNALLQCLCHSEFISRYFRFRESLNGFEYTVGDIVNTYHSSEFGELMPREFIEELRKNVPSYIPGEQVDVCELWMTMCESIARAAHPRYEPRQVAYAPNCLYGKVHRRCDETVAKYNKGISSEWLDMVQGVMICQTNCPHCEHISHTFEPFTVLTLDCSGETLLHCLETYMETEEIDGWKCEKCEAVCKTIKYLRFWKIPRVFCISLKRFSCKDGNVAKNTTPVRIPIDFTLITEGVLGPQRESGEKFLFLLRAAAIHHGDIGGGHYTAAVMEDDAHWFHCDDASVSPISGEPLTELFNQSYFILYDVMPTY